VPATPGEQSQHTRAAESELRERVWADRDEEDPLFLTPAGACPAGSVAKRPSENGNADRRRHAADSGALRHVKSSNDLQQRPPPSSDVTPPTSVADRPFTGSSGAGQSQLCTAASPAGSGRPPGRPPLQHARLDVVGRTAQVPEARHRCGSSIGASSVMHSAHGITSDPEGQNGNAKSRPRSLEEPRQSRAADDSIMDVMSRQARMASGALFGLANTVASSSNDLVESSMQALGAKPTADSVQAVGERHSSNAGSRPGQLRSEHASRNARQQSPSELVGESGHLTADSDAWSSGDEGNSALFADSPRGPEREQTRLHGELTGQVVHLSAELFDHVYAGVLSEGEGRASVRATVKHALHMRRRTHAAWDIVVQQWSCNEVRRPHGMILARLQLLVRLDSQAMRFTGC
jgi:hypothetical protein